MNFKWDKKYLYWGVTAFCVVAGSVLFTICVSNFGQVTVFVSNILGMFMPFVYGFAFAYLLSPVMNFFEKKCFRVLFKKRWDKKLKKKGVLNKTPLEIEMSVIKASRTLGVAAAMMIATACLVGLVSAVLPQLVITITNFINSSPAYLNQVNSWAEVVLKDFPEVEVIVTDFISNFTTYFLDFLQVSILPQVSDIVSGVSSGVMTTINILLNVLIGFVMCIYLLYGKELFAAQGKKILYGMLKPKNANLILRNLRHVHKTFGGFIIGKLIDSLIIGMIFFIILTVFDMPYVVLISVILGVTNIIPFFGPFIGAIPSALLILLVDPVKCIYLIVIVLIVQQFDGNVLGPKILGDNTGLSSFWVIFALLLGQNMFGFIGLIIGIPLFSVMYSIIKARISLRLEKKGMPVDSNTYRSLAYIDKDTGDMITLEELKIAEEKETALKEKERKSRKKEKSNSIRDFIQNKNKK